MVIGGDEEMATLFRGPLVPRRIERPLRDGFTMQSSCDSDLAIFDTKLGLFDTTYSNAWLLGKTLALADQGFSTAIARIRNVVHGRSLDRSKQESHALLGDGGLGSRTKRADSMIGLFQDLSDTNANLHASGDATTSLAEDKEGISANSIDMISQTSPHISAQILCHSDVATPTAAVSEKEDILYNEFNLLDSPDYAYIYSWILDTAHLTNVPSHYLIPDPSFLPEETL
ncbi:hypothetical protein ACQKWADRAFT_154558 [Trichoderma austrokoningii]